MAHLRQGVIDLATCTRKNLHIKYELGHIRADAREAPGGHIAKDSVCHLHKAEGILNQPH